MLANSETNMLVSHRGLTDSFAFDQKVIDIENVEMLERDITNLEPINHSSDLVYVIYTSGTTGKPKGVSRLSIAVLLMFHMLGKKSLS